MNSLDFLTPSEVVEDCVRWAVIPALAITVVGLVAWAVLAAFNSSTDAEPARSLVFPFFATAIYGNVVIYRVRWKHGIQVWGGRWWVGLSALALIWSITFVGIGFVVEFALVSWAILHREVRPLSDVTQTVLAMAALALLFSFFPTRGPSEL